MRLPRSTADSVDSKAGLRPVQLGQLRATGDSAAGLSPKLRFALTNFALTYTRALRKE